ncbi:MAG: hypothetical protein M1832_005769 [Thelocarpon impressellum]|nr:MAG: hypothetical protein M1832_005769 [Thelocarpon impressellum]
MDRHNEAVAVIAADMRGFYDRKEAFRIYHGSTNSTRQLRYQRRKMIDTSQLTKVLRLDGEAKTALVEPNVPMDQLVQATLPSGLLPPVVMEFPGITVGGGYAGTAGESSSFKYGFFHGTVNWVEMVLANGDVVRASGTERADLFHGAAGTCGTLGVTTLLEIRLIEARTFVELTYHPVSSVSESIERLEGAQEDMGNDYVDGILFALDRAVVMTGRLTNEVRPGVKIQRFSRASDPWFYLHVERVTRSSVSPVTEAIPLVDYLFRYDRGGFWVGRYAYRYFLTPFNRVTRWALDYFMHTRVMYHALHESGLSQRYIIQDLALPRSTVEEFIKYVDRTIGCYPLWLCSLRPREGDQLSLHPHSASGPRGLETLVNVGVWGPGPTTASEFVELNRALERKVRELSGMKWLYAHAYYTRDEFWSIYDQPWYEALRAKYDAASLPNVYDKVVVDPAAQRDAFRGLWRLWPLRGLYGVAKTLLGSDYLLESESRTRRALAWLFGALVLLISLVPFVGRPLASALR